MDCETTMRMDDRLSVLPDDVIFKILCFVGLKDAIKTSVLSSRWRFMWTSIPHLRFSSNDFSTMDKLSNSVTHVLSHYNNQVSLSSFNLRICQKGGHDVTQRIMNHVFSLNVRYVRISCSFESKFDAFPLSLSGSQTLKNLTLRRISHSWDQIVLTSAHEFSSLTTLHLTYITLYDGFLSMCPNLKKLTLHRCKVSGQHVLRICHPRLSNLTLKHVVVGTVSVVTPQLKILTISNYPARYQVSAPALASLHLTTYCPSMFSTDGFHSLEESILSFRYPKSAQVIISMLQQFHSVKHLSLSTETIQVLNLFVELISHQPSPLVNLESLRILSKILCVEKHVRTRVIMSTEVKNYLLSGSPKATLTEVLV